MRTLGALAATATAAMMTFAVPAYAGGRVLGLDAPGAIPGRYVVTLKDGVATADSVGHVLKRSGSTYTTTMSAAQARRLAADPDVRFVEQDRHLYATATERNPDWGLDRIDQRSAALSHTYTPMDDGDRVHAYVIDTGIRVSHQDFGGRASYGWDFVDNDATAYDCDGHGTHVAGTIGGTKYGVAKKVQLVAVRVLDCNGEGDLSDVIAGVDWVTGHAVKPAVANMSMAGAHSASLDSAIQRSINSGVTYVVAAGNENVNAAAESPAGMASAITVGASDRTDARAYFSNYGPSVDLFAPGVGIRSDWDGSDTSTAVLSGTSMASPQVAGAAAMVLDAYPSYSPGQVQSYLVARATTGRVKNALGSANRLLFTPPPAAAPAITSTRLAAIMGHPYSAKLTATRGGTWTVAAGALPAGMSLSRAGVVSGTPTTPGSTSVTVRLTDYVPNVVTRRLTVTVARTSPTIATPPLPDATTGTDYSTRLTTRDGRPGTWCLTAGSLPDGLTLSPDGTIAGTPTTEGESAFTIRFADPWGGLATTNATIRVQP